MVESSAGRLAFVGDRYSRGTYELIAVATELDAVLGRVRTGPDTAGAPAVASPARQPRKTEAAAASSLSFEQLLGRLKKCVTDVRKNARDIPRMAEHPVIPRTPDPTPDEHGKARRELFEIRETARGLAP